MNGGGSGEGERKHPPTAQEAALEAPTDGRAGNLSKDAEGREGASSVSRGNWFEIATLVVLTFTLFAAGYTAYEGSLLSKATSNLVQTNADTAHRELRAYVGVIPGGVENFGDGQNQRLTIFRR